MPVMIAPQTPTEEISDLVRSGGYCGSHRLPCSFFKGGVVDTSPINWHGSWKKLVQAGLRDFPFDEGLPPSASKKTLPAICGGEFMAGASRKREHVVQIGLLLGDVDNTVEVETSEYHCDLQGHPSDRPVMKKVPIENPATMAQVADAIEAAGASAILWDTWSSSPANPRFRFAVPLALPIKADLWPQAAEYAIHALGLDPYRPGLDIPVLRNPAALAFLPGALNPENLGRCFVDGDPLHIPLSALSLASPPKPSLSAWQTEIVRTRSSKSGPRWWRTYLDQGRLSDFHMLDLAGILTSLGCWVGAPRAWKSGTKYRCSCPWHREHSGGVDDDSAVIFMEPGKWPVWHCSHASHAHMGLRDILELAWGRP